MLKNHTFVSCDSMEHASTQNAVMARGVRTHGGSQFIAFSERHPAHTATWNQVGQITYQAPLRQRLTATSVKELLQKNVAAVSDMAKKSSRKHEKKEIPGQTGSLDPVEAGSVAKSYNVKLQLADASESSGPTKDLAPNDVPAWRTKMCENRIQVLQSEKRKLREKERALQTEIERKTALRNRAAADLSWRQKEIGFVGQTVIDFRKELAHREQEVAGHIEEERAAILEAARQIGIEKRTKQNTREETVTNISAYELTARQCKNKQADYTSMVTLANIFSSIEQAHATNGEEMRVERAKNTATIADVAQKELERLQKINETVKEDAAVTAKSLREKIEHTQKMRSEEYLANRTAQFNEFRKAAMVTAHMQKETRKSFRKVHELAYQLLPFLRLIVYSAIIDQLRHEYENTRALEKTLAKI